MRLIAKIQLQTNEGMFAALHDTLREANRCCNWLSEQAWQLKTFARFKIQRLVYVKARERFPALSSNTIIRCIAKVADSYRLNKNFKRSFKLCGAIAYNPRILRWYIEKQTVSIWTTSGRLKIPYLCGERQREMLKTQQGESDLILFRNRFYLASTCNIDEPEPSHIEGVIGCDMGVANILTSSDGTNYSGSHVKSVRHRHKRLRTKLQKKGTKSAKRRLKNLSGRERRFAKDVNHRISKQIVAHAKCTKRAIAVEDLTGIRSRIKAGRKQRGVLHSWAFAQLGTFIAYKAKQAGVVVVTVDPRNTSRGCSQCGHTQKGNRPSQSKFQCRQCGFMAHADQNAAQNIRALGRAALVNQPNVAGCVDSLHNSVASPSL